MSSNSALTIASEVELVPANCFDRLDFQSIFGRDAAIEIDLGCGEGSFLSAVAAESPEVDFLGVERLLGRVRSACRRIERKGLTNVRVARLEIGYAVEYLLPPGSVTTFYVLFPDPWPKRRHAPRRLVTAGFLESLHRALRPQGTVRIATDETEYFRQITRVVAQAPFFAVVPGMGSIHETKFERRFRERGLPIHRLELRKVSPVT